jgi:hypothetical protein
VRVSAQRTGGLGVAAHRDRLVDGNQVAQLEPVAVLHPVYSSHFIRVAGAVVAGDRRHLAGLQRALGEEALPEANDGANRDARRGRGEDPDEELVDVLDGQAGTTINRKKQYTAGMRLEQIVFICVKYESMKLTMSKSFRINGE